MVNVVDQTKENIYRIRYYHLKFDSDLNVYQLIGSDADTKELVLLGVFNFYKQAIETFARIDYLDNDLFYFKDTKKVFEVPENITDPQVCLSIYGSLY